MDKLGDLSQFDGHTMMRPIEFYRGPDRQLEELRYMPENKPDELLLKCAPDLLAALKESRKENEKLRERAAKAIGLVVTHGANQGSLPAMIERALEILEGKQ